MSLWPAVQDERATLADHLDDLSPHRWVQQSLCGRWTVHEVVAHLTAAASIGRLRWLASVAGARLDFDLHNQRRLRQHQGADHKETLRRFRDVISSTTAASGHTPAWLGEVVVHTQDILRPLGIDHTPPVETTTAVAHFYAARDFTVSSRTAIKGLRLEATDGPFATGEGPRVIGTTLALTMAMAGRATFCADLEGEGAVILCKRQTTD